MEVPNTQKWRVVAVITLGMFMAILDNSIVSVILPQMQKAFNANVDTITWVITAYFLAQAAVIPVAGYLSDLIGSKRVFLITLGLFTVGSVLCAISPTKEALIAFRVVQGIGGGALLPVGFAIAYRTFPPQQRASITAIISIPIIMAPSFGPTLGGFLGTNFNWNAIFTINIPFGVAGLVMGYLFLQKDSQTIASLWSPQTREAKKRFDIVGLLLSMVGFTTLVYGISQASTKSWTDQTVLIPLLIGGAVLIAFVVVELRVSDPVMDIRLFMNYTFSISSVLTWILMAMVYGGIFLIPTFFENVKGDTALTAGVYMIMTGVSTGVGLAIAGKIYNRVGARFLIVSGMILLAVGTYGLTQLTVDTTGESLQVWLFVRGVGVGFTTQSLQVLALSVVSNRAMARASSLYNVTRQVAGAVGIAGLAAFLTQQATTHATDIGRALQVGLQTHQLTGDAAACARTVPLTPQGLQACVVQHATTTGLSETFLITLIFYAVCAGLGLIVGRDPTIQAQKLATAGGEKVQVANTGSREKIQTAQAGKEKVQISSIHNIISTLGDNGDEVMGPEILLWRYPQSDIVNGSLLTVESNQFCVLKLRGTLVDVYETGQHIVQTPDHLLASSTQLAFNGEPIPLQYEAIYINRAKLLIKTSGVALSHEMAELDYNVDYYIYVATPDDAIKLIQHMPQRGHALSIGELNVYAWPIIEETVNQLLQSTPLEQTQGQQIAQDLSQRVHQRLQPFLATYGITLDMVKAQGRGPRSKYTKELISLKALGLSDLDAVHHYIAMNKSEAENYSVEQQEELERSLYMILHKTLSHYSHEISTLQADLEKMRASIGQNMESYNTRLQELSRAINTDIGACVSVLEGQKASTPVTRETQQVTAVPKKPWNGGGTGKFRVRLAPMEPGVVTTTEPVGTVRYSARRSQ